MPARRDQRSLEAKAWRPYYKTPQWKAIRRQQLATHPLCEQHLKLGQVVAADTCHHVNPHKGDWELFLTGPFESVCGACHAGPIQSAEARGVDYSDHIDPRTGFPLDKNHPFWAT
jgi:5-methylcytosine-specific restriction protein A